MAYNNIIPQIGEVYHVYSRGIEKRNIFSNQIDYIRFLHDLYEFNDENPAFEFERRYKPQNYVGGQTSHIRERLQKPIVNIIAFCLMKNHYHLLISPIIDNGLSLFMKKLNTGYAMAFNAKYKRSGHLFQGRYKLKHVDKEEYLRHLIFYIHFNPMKFCKKLDKNGRLDIDKTLKALSEYRWSSHPDYLGQDNFGSIIDKQSVSDIFSSAVEYKKFVNDWMKHFDENEYIISPVAIDAE